jgi:hypothetical protein
MSEPEHIVVTHADAEAVELKHRIDVAQGEEAHQRMLRSRRQEQIRAQAGEKFAHLLGVSQGGTVTQKFSGAAATADGCGCDKPDFSSIKEPTVFEFVQTPPASGRGYSPSQAPRGGRSTDDRARTLAARVDRARTFAASKPSQVALFDAAGELMGTANPKDVQQPSNKIAVVFDQNGSLLGVIDPAKIGKLASPPTAPQPAQTPAQPVQQPQPASQEPVGGQLATRYRR